MNRTLAIALLFAFAVSCGRSNLPSGPAAVPFERTTPLHVPVVGGCQMFPADNPWNKDVSNDRLDPLSPVYIAALPGNLSIFADSSGGGIPFNIVPAGQKKVPVEFKYWAHSDKGPYPIPPNAQIQGGRDSSGDRHVLVLQQGACKLYEMWKSYELDGGKRWSAGSGAIFRLNTNKLRPNGWTSADAAGLPILPALVKCGEVRGGAIDHALRVTFENTQAGYIHPATHFSSNSRAQSLPPMGLRFRLKASYDTSHIRGQAHVIVVALKKYGMFVSDSGPNWQVTGEGGTGAKCWNNADLGQLRSIPHTAFEVVETGKIIRYP